MNAWLLFGAVMFLWVACGFYAYHLDRCSGKRFLRKKLDAMGLDFITENLPRIRLNSTPLWQHVFWGALGLYCAFQVYGPEND